MDHDPHPPFIRITDWRKDEHSQWMSAKSICSICRKQVALVFGDKTRWEHVDERRGHREP